MNNLFVFGAALGAATNTATRAGAATATRPAEPQAATRPAATEPARTAPAKLSFGHADYDEALKTAERTGRPLVVKVGASWCGPCKAMARDAWPDAGVQKLLKDRAVFVEVNVDAPKDSAANRAKAQDLAEAYGASGYPTTYIATLKKNAGGEPTVEILREKSGGMSARELQTFLKDQRKGLPAAQEIMELRGFTPQSFVR